MTNKIRLCLLLAMLTIAGACSLLLLPASVWADEQGAYYAPNGRNRLSPGRTFVLRRRDNSSAPVPNAAWLVQAKRGDAGVKFSALYVPVHDDSLTGDDGVPRRSLVVEVPAWGRISGFFDLNPVSELWQAEHVVLCLATMSGDSLGSADLSLVFSHGFPQQSPPLQATFPIENWAQGSDSYSAQRVCAWFLERAPCELFQPVPHADQLCDGVPAPSLSGPVQVQYQGSLLVEVANKWSSLIWATGGLFLLWIAFFAALRMAGVQHKNTKVNFLTAPLTAIEVEGRASLSRFQMAVWTVVTAFGLIFVWTMEERFLFIPDDVISFLGIGGLTLAVRNQLPGRKSGAPNPNRFGSWANLLVANGKVDISRAQLLLFTLIVAIAVMKELVEFGRFPEFDSSIAVLMGLSSATYLAGTGKFGQPPPHEGAKSTDRATAAGDATAAGNANADGLPNDNSPSANDVQPNKP